MVEALWESNKVDEDVANNSSGKQLKLNKIKEKESNHGRHMKGFNRSKVKEPRGASRIHQLREPLALPFSTTISCMQARRLIAPPPASPSYLFMLNP